MVDVSCPSFDLMIRVSKVTPVISVYYYVSYPAPFGHLVKSLIKLPVSAESSLSDSPCQIEIPKAI